jgi:hypothetical protein
MNITQKQYPDLFKKVPTSELSNEMEDSHELLKKLTKNWQDWNKVNNNATYSKMYKAQVDLLKAIVAETTDSKSNAKNNTPASKKSNDQKKSPTKTKTPKPKQADKAALLSRQGNPVEAVDPHIIMLTRFYKMHGKQVPREKVVTLARSMVRKIESRELKKASKYAALIERMQAMLSALLNTNKKIFSVTIAPDFLSKVEKSAADEYKMASVQLLSRYAGLAEKQITIVQAERLLSAMERAVEKNVIPKSDRYFKRIKSAMKALSEYLEMEDESQTLPLIEGELSGLGCACNKDARQINSLGDWIKLHKQQGQGKAVNSMDFIKSEFVNYPLDGDWLEVFGRPIPGKHTIVYSGAKNAKTTTLLSFAGYLARNFGPVLFVSKEEGISGTLQEKFAITGAQHPNLTLVEDLPDTEELYNYRFVFLDSSSKLQLSPEQLSELQKELAPFVCIYAILHATKTGQHRGSNEYKHDADHVVNFPEFGVARGEGRFSGCTNRSIRFAPEREE